MHLNQYILLDRLTMPPAHRVIYCDLVQTGLGAAADSAPEWW